MGFWFQKRGGLAYRKRSFLTKNIKQAFVFPFRYNHGPAYPNFFDKQKETSTAWLYNPIKKQYFFYYDRSTETTSDEEYAMFTFMTENPSDETFGWYKTVVMRIVQKKA